MSDKEQATLLLNNTRIFLKENKAEILNLLKDKKVAIWRDIKLDPHKRVLKALGISTQVIKKTLLKYPEIAKKISKQITVLDNEIGNRQADLIGKTDPKKVLTAAKKIDKASLAIDKLKDSLLKEIGTLLDIDAKLRQCLNVKEIVDLALALSEKHKKQFMIGLEMFNLVSDELDKDASNSKTLPDVIQHARTIETRFQHLEIIGLPRLTEEVLFRFVDLGSKTTKEVIVFIEKFNSRLANELNTVRNIDQELIALQNLSIPQILSGITSQSKSLSGLVCGFYHKRQLKGNLQAIDQTLELLNVYHLTLKNKLIKSIPVEIETPGSKINHVDIAEKMTKSFFIGAKGIVRSVKMMVTSLKGDEAVNEIELQLILEKAITKCSSFYESGETRKKNMTTFTDGLIHHFPKPFPYDDLFKLVQTTISTYAKELEGYITTFTIDSDMKSLATVSIPSTLGQLIAQIKKKQSDFKKANEQ